MRVFTCLSRNVSLALDTTQRLYDERRPKNRLNFKNKKRRTNAPDPASTVGTPKRSAPAARVLVSKQQQNTAVKTTTGKSIRFQDENTPPPSSYNYSAGSMDNSKKSRVPPTLPLPPIPDLDSSVYIKELDDSLNNDSDYLPLSHVEPYLTEEETTATSSPSLLLSSHHYSSTTAATSTASSDYTLASPASQDETMYQTIDNPKTESTTTFSNVKSVGSFNDAFIQSCVSLPRLKNVLSSTRLDDRMSRTTRHQSSSKQNASSMTSADPKDTMTYSRRRVQNAKQKRQRMENDYYNDGVSCGSNSSASVGEVSDLLEASVAEYNNFSARRRGEKRSSRRSVVTDTVEIFASNCTLNEYSSLGVQTQSINVEDTTQQSQDFVYSRLVDYTSSAYFPSEAETEEEESRYYENEVRPAMLCEGQSQTNLVRSRGTSAVPQNTTCATDSMLSKEENSQVDDYCASQSSCGSFEDQTEYTAASFHSYVNVDVVHSADENSYANIERSRRNDDNSVHVDDDTCSDSRASEFLGCMSFGVPHLLKKDLDGWYYLLTEEVGRKKHLQARGVKKPVLTSRGQPNVPIPNLMMEGDEKIVISVPRGKNGFGFSFIDELPPKIGRVDRASPAEKAGVMKGDVVVSINGKNVSRSTSKGVAHLVKQLKAKSLTLELQRDHIIHPASVNSGSCTQNLPSTTKRSVGTSHNDDHLYESIMERSAARDHHKENRRAHWLEEETAQTEEDLVTDDSQNYTQYKMYGGSVPNLKGLTSTPMPRTALYHKTNASMARQECIHRLMSLELDFIDFMHYGTERYSRPLRHCIISAQQHGVMFQNVEKLVTISEYHIKQMQENAASSVNSEDTDDSQSSESSNMFPNSVALIYQSKVHMLCQAYESYAHGLLNSNTLLRELRANRDFVNFIKETPSADGGSMFGHPTISAFINRPVQHINELYTVFSEIFSMTPRHSPDYPVLQKITCKLAQCITAITSLSSAGRVHSLDSLTSSQGCSTSQTSSGKGSMASLTSCSSAEMDALRTMKPPSSSSSSSARPVDAEVARIQDRLVFPPHIPTFQLCQEDRHIIFQGDMYRCQQGTWFKSHLLLLSDLLLILDQEPNGRLRVVDTPIYLSDVSGIEVNRKHASEFILHLHTTAAFSTLPRTAQPKHHAPNTRPLVLRAPSAQEKFMWKSLLEQRVSSVSGVRLQHYGSMRDISNVKTSVVL